MTFKAHAPDVYTSIMEYLAVTKKLTGQKTKQLISFNNKALSKDMIAIWEKTVLLQAGVDTSVSSAQNT